MTRRLLLTLVLCAAAAASQAQLPGLVEAARKPRPVTSLRVAKSGANAVLTWTCDQTGVRYRVQRGILHPEYHSRVILAVTDVDVLTYTDTGALTATVLGTVTEYFWVVDAIPLEPNPLAAPAALFHEWKEERNASQILKYELSNGAVYSTEPHAVIVGRDNNFAMPGAAPAASGPWLFEAENAPTPGGVTGLTVIVRNEAELYPNTVDHDGLYAGAAFVAIDGPQTAPGNTARSTPTPVASRDGNSVTVTWIAPSLDVEGVVTHVKVYRGYEGTGDGDGTLLATVPVATTSFVDDISEVPAGYYIFYTLACVFSDGHVGPHSAVASDGTGAIQK